jgi:hypothetical protein
MESNLRHLLYVNIIHCNLIHNGIHRSMPINRPIYRHLRSTRMAYDCICMWCRSYRIEKGGLSNSLVAIVLVAEVTFSSSHYLAT